jgi:class 3 adenylate cyclase
MADPNGLIYVRDAEVRYAERDGDYLAFSVFGDGPTDLAVALGRFPIDFIWEFPPLGAFMEALGQLARVIVYDGRGFGASDPYRETAVAAAEVWADDLLAVLDAADSDSASMFQGGDSSYGVVIAATYPERVRSLILVSFRPSFPELQKLSVAQRKKLVMNLRRPERLRFENPRVAHDPLVRRWWEHAVRLGTSPAEQARNIETATGVDLWPLLPTIRTPTLVLHRRDNRVWDIETSRQAASRMPNARFVELPGGETDIFLGETAPVLAAVEQFLAEPATDVASDRVLATVLFTDIVASTEQLAVAGDEAWGHLLDDHEYIAARLVRDHRGRVVKQLGDGILATFDGPGRAVRCAGALRAAASERGLTLRAGLHMGEIQLRSADVTGIAVVIAERINELAAPGEILVSRTVVDLTTGSGLRFEPRGDQELKGVPGTWPIFAARPHEA